MCLIRMPRPSMKSTTFADPPKPEHVGGQHAVTFGQRADGVLPADPGVGAELAAVQ